MAESINFQAVLDDMRDQLAQARLGGRKPTNWLVRMEMLAPLCAQARGSGVLTGDAAHIYGLMVRGSWQLLQLGETPLLVCEGDEYHDAIAAMYAKG